MPVVVSIRQHATTRTGLPFYPSFSFFSEILFLEAHSQLPPFSHCCSPLAQRLHIPPCMIYVAKRFRAAKQSRERRCLEKPPVPLPARAPRIIRPRHLATRADNHQMTMISAAKVMILPGGRFPQSTLLIYVPATCNKMMSSSSRQSLTSRFTAPPPWMIWQIIQTVVMSSGPKSSRIAFRRS